MVHIRNTDKYIQINMLMEILSSHLNGSHNGANQTLSVWWFLRWTEVWMDFWG